LDLVEGVWIAA
jgi:hypothetical protein